MAALITVEPAETPVTRPVALTVATAGTELVHVNVNPGTFPPVTFVAVADSCCVDPTELIVADVGETDIEVALLITVSVAVSAFPPYAPMILVVPTASDVTKPAVLTVATA